MFRRCLTRPPVVVLAVLAACVSPSAEFCSAASNTLERERPTDGGDLVEDLRSLDLSDLSESDRRSMVLGIDRLERDLRAFNDGTSTDGWSTQIVADSVNRICQTDVGYQVVMP